MQNNVANFRHFRGAGNRLHCFRDRARGIAKVLSCDRIMNWLKQHWLEGVGVIAAIVGVWIAWKHVQNSQAQNSGSSTDDALAAALAQQEQQAALQSLLGTSTTSAPVTASTAANSTTTASQPTSAAISTPVTPAQTVTAQTATMVGGFPAPVETNTPLPGTYFDPNYGYVNLPTNQPTNQPSNTNEVPGGAGATGGNMPVTSSPVTTPVTQNPGDSISIGLQKKVRAI